jgi:hypothetical protein
MLCVGDAGQPGWAVGNFLLGGCRSFGRTQALADEVQMAFGCGNAVW